MKLAELDTLEAEDETKNERAKACSFISSSNGWVNAVPIAERGCKYIWGEILKFSFDLSISRVC